MVELFSDRWGAIGLLPDTDAEGRMVSEDQKLKNAEMDIRMREWIWPSCWAATGTFRFSSDERMVVSGFEAAAVLVVLFKHSLQIQLSAVKREMHDGGAFLIFPSGRNMVIQFLANRDYQLVLISYPSGFGGGFLKDIEKDNNLQTPKAGWYYTRPFICTRAMQRDILKISEEPGGIWTEDGWAAGLCWEILMDYLSSKTAHFQSPHVAAAQLDDFYSSRDRLMAVIDRIASFSKLLTAADIRDRPLFRKRMNQVYGLNIRDFIIQARLEKAISLLADYSLSIKQIAAMTGFKNAFYFSRVFSRHFGRSPKSYRVAGI